MHDIHISDDVLSRLDRFRHEHQIISKGKLSLVIQLTRMIRTKSFPLTVSDFQTANKGQVAGLGGAKLKAILKEYGITKQLAAEGGRTSRGNMGLMIAYIDFLNKWHEEASFDVKEVEAYWAKRIEEFFASQPFHLSGNTMNTIRYNIGELFQQVRKREHENPGSTYLGTVLQHLVEAKLQTILGDEAFTVHGASVADSPTEREGDFSVKSTVFHCTTMPGDLLIEKCRRNIRAGYHPVIITIYERVITALTLLEDASIKDRVEVWDIQQFLSANVLEHSVFDEQQRNHTLGCIIQRYNEIIASVEHDPSLRILFDCPAVDV